MSRTLSLATCVFAASLLSGCGSDSDFSQMGGLLWQSVSGIGGEAPGIKREQAAAVPYASLGMRLGSGPEGMLILATDTSGDSEWLAGTQLGIVLRNGRIIRSVGLPHNLSGFQGPIPDSGTDASKGRYHYLYDYAERRVFGLVVECTEHDAGPEKVDLVGGAKNARHIVETCEAPQAQWEFQNDYWRDPQSGYVWKSIQNVFPHMDTVTLSVLRPQEK